MPGDADQAIVRLGAPGVVRAVVVDTSHFTGNFPTEASVDGVALDGAPSVDALRAADWTPLVERSALKGDTRERVHRSYSPRRWTHVRLNIFPDGGVARLRVHGEVVADPRVVEALGTVDLAALELGGRVTRLQQPVLRLAGPADRPRAGALDGRGLGDGATS